MKSVLTGENITQYRSIYNFIVTSQFQFFPLLQWHIPNLHYYEEKTETCESYEPVQSVRECSFSCFTAVVFLIPAVALCTSRHKNKNQLKAFPPLQGATGVFFCLMSHKCFSQQPQSSQELISCLNDFTEGGPRRDCHFFFSGIVCC